MNSMAQERFNRLLSESYAASWLGGPCPMHAATMRRVMRGLEESAQNGEQGEVRRFEAKRLAADHPALGKRRS